MSIRQLQSDVDLDEEAEMRRMEGDRQSCQHVLMSHAQHRPRAQVGVPAVLLVQR